MVIDTLLKSENAEFKIEKPELIDMKKVNAIFYFKDGTELNVLSDMELIIIKILI